MRLALLLCLTATTGLWACACEHPPATVDAPSTTSSEAAPPVGLALAWGEDGHLQATLANRGSTPISVHGHGPDAPFYALRVQEADGTWRDALIGWCGTGASDHQIAAGGSTSFAAHDASQGAGRALQVVVTYRDAAGAEHQVVSEPLPRPAPPTLN